MQGPVAFVHCIQIGAAFLKQYEGGLESCATGSDDSARTLRRFRIGFDAYPNACDVSILDRLYKIHECEMILYYMGPIGMQELFVILLVLLVISACVFWIKMLIEAATKEPDTGNTRLVWVIIIVFTQIIGALIYYFVRRPQRRWASRR